MRGDLQLSPLVTRQISALLSVKLGETVEFNIPPRLPEPRQRPPVVELVSAVENQYMHWPSSSSIALTKAQSGDTV